MVIREYDPSRDREAVHRIWLECGWIEKGEEDALDRFVKCGHALVAELHGQAECVVLTAPGRMRYLKDDLPLSCVTGVTTGRIARKQGFAKRLLARILCDDAADGMVVSALGMFEQGFYDQLGYGTGGYERLVAFDPLDLNVAARPRTPRRFTASAYEAAHAARLRRLRLHGGCNVLPVEITRSDMEHHRHGFGLGYYDDPAGMLSHYIWGTTSEVESGPYNLTLVYRDYADLTELLALIRSIGDQVRLVRMREPSGIQLQDLLTQPFRNRALTKSGRFEASMRADAYWQARMLDVPACVARATLHGPVVRFNLALSDPVERFLDEGLPWRGVAGEYVVAFGERSCAAPGRESALPTLTASVGAFTRLWLGVRPATGLAATDDLAGPPELLSALDDALRLPEPHIEWDF